MGAEVKGLNEILNKINRIGGDLPKQAALEMRAFAEETNTMILQNIRAEGLIGVSSFLMQHQVVEVVDDNNTRVANTAFYAPFQEFGTGAKVSVPSEFAQVAADAQNQPKRGDFDKFVESLAEWARIKGIIPNSGTTPKDYERMAYIMAVNIYRNGLKPRPFFFKAFVQIRPRIIATMQKLVQTYTK